MQKVGIVGVGLTKNDENKSDMWQGDVVYAAIEAALKDSGITYQDVSPDGFGIERILTTGEDHFIGKTCNSFWIHHYLGAFNLSQDNVSGDGTYAVYHAVMDILSGHYDIVMVSSIVKESETLREGIENCMFDHIFMQPLGLDSLTSSALQAKRYMDKYGITAEQCARVAVKNRKNAKNNPYAQESGDITVEDVISSKMLASPIHLLDSRPLVSDGACVLILASEETAKKITDKPVWITGVGNCYDAHLLGDRDLGDCDSLVTAAKRAYDVAGIKDPMKEIDVAEISTEYTYQELLWTEGLGLCGRGEGAKLLESGATEMSGQLPINPSGGILAGNPLQVAGTTRVAEAAMQLRGDAGARQVKNAKTALAHGFYGPCGQSQCVIVLGN